MLPFSHFYCILGVDFFYGLFWCHITVGKSFDFTLFFFADLSAVRRLMSNESTPLLSRNSRTASTTSSVKNYTDFSSFTCPSCRMPFDKAKKRRLVDTCGHERCYACMFRNETCPICNASGKWKSDFQTFISSSQLKRVELFLLWETKDFLDIGILQ